MADLEQIETKLEAVQSGAEVVEQFLIGLVAKSTTWLSGIVPAIFIYGAIREFFPGIDWRGAFLIAYVIEALGLTTIVNTMEGWQFYQSQKTSQARTLFLVALLTALFYVVLNIVLVLVLKVNSDYANWATGLLASLSLIAGISTVMRMWQSSRNLAERREKRHAERLLAESERRKLEAEEAKLALQIERQRAEMEIKLAEKRAKAAGHVSNLTVQSASKVDKITPEAPKMDAKNGQKLDNDIDRMVEIYRANPKASLRHVGRILDRSPQTISNHLKALEGVRFHKNGNGVEVLEGKE